MPSPCLRRSVRPARSTDRAHRCARAPEHDPGRPRLHRQQMGLVVRLALGEDRDRRRASASTRDSSRTCCRLPRGAAVDRAVDRDRAREPQERPGGGLPQGGHREEAREPRERGRQERRIDEPSVMVRDHQQRPIVGRRVPGRSAPRCGTTRRSRGGRSAAPSGRGANPMVGSSHDRSPLRMVVVADRDGIRRWRRAAWIGPAAFTAAWALGTVRQPGYSVSDEHISGLAAPDATDPERDAGGSWPSARVRWASPSRWTGRLGAGVGQGIGQASADQPASALRWSGHPGSRSVVAGLLRRDRMSNYPAPGARRPASPGSTTAMTLASVAGAGRRGAVRLGALAPLRLEPRAPRSGRPAMGRPPPRAGSMAWFARAVTRPGNGLVQRVGVSIPLLLHGAAGVRLLARPTTP